MVVEQSAVADGTAGSLAREFEFSGEDFERVRRLVYAQMGIALGDSKRELVYARLSRRIRALELGSFRQYLQLIEGGNAAELENFCNAITTNLTSFFRENHHFTYIAERLLPALAGGRARARRVRIWSAGCSTGEEPYSIAMVILESLGQLRGWDIRILATDIDSSVLSHARRGVYAGERLQKMAGERVQRWFERSAQGNQYQVREQLKRLVTFNCLNLIGDWPMHGPFELIMCRNVVIYFDRDIQRRLISRMAALQRPGDHLILGHSESLLNVSSQYRAAGHSIYRRLD
jgi:chemotaxis protein methyltransferase CheR